MNILNLCKRDYAGLAIRLTDAINGHTLHRARLITRAGHRFEYPTDMRTRNLKTIKKWVDWADVVNCWPTYDDKFLCTIHDKKLIWTHIGSSLRKRPKILHRRAKQLNAVELVATPDLMFFKNVKWLPNAVPVDCWFKTKTPHSGKPIVCQSPSGRKGKRTDEILDVISDKDNVNLLIIEGVTWGECMHLKSKADIYIGEFNIGYGMGELEAMAMKIPVITHLKHKNEAAMRREVGELPHYDCNMAYLSEAIDHLLSDKDRYNHHAELGFEYVKKFHDYPIVADKFISVCEAL